MFNFQKLDVWNKSIEFNQQMLKVADQLPQKYQFSLGEQLRRAAISIPNNIAEGSGRSSKKEAANFYNIAKGSVYEVVNLLIIASKTKLLNGNFNQVKTYESAEELAKMLTGLMKAQK